MTDETNPVPWPFTDQFKAIVIIAKVSGALSIIASCFIIRDILDKSNRAENLSRIRNRILLLFSFGDISHSFCHFLGTWMVPAGMAWGAAGNQATCTFQGGLTQFSAKITTCLNASLAISYVVVVCFGWKEDWLRKPLPQFFFFGIPFLFSIGIVIFALIDEAYNYSGGWICYINSYPRGCTKDPDVDCERGEHAMIIEWVNAAAGSWVPTIIVFLSCIMLWWAVRRKEVQSQRFSFDGEQNRTLSNRIAMQGIYYSGVFFVTYMFYYVMVFIKHFGDGNSLPPWVLFAHVLIVPFQGVLNAFVYFRPALLAKQRTKQKEKEKAKMKLSQGEEQRKDVESVGRYTQQTNNSSKLDSSLDYSTEEGQRKETQQTGEEDTQLSSPEGFMQET